MNEKPKVLALSAFTLMLVGAAAATVQAKALSAPISRAELSASAATSPMGIPGGNHDHNWLGGDHDHPAAVRVAGSHTGQFDV